LAVVPVHGRAVAVSGARGSFTTETGSKGVYSLKVKRGHYTLRLPGSTGNANPKSRSVNANRDLGHLDFLVCKEPVGYHGPKLPCGLVEIDGQAVDIAGKPYANGIASTKYDSAGVDAQGQFVLFVKPGRVSVDVTASSFLRHLFRPTSHAPSGLAFVNAAPGVNTVRVELRPSFEFASPENTADPPDTAGVDVFIDGLPLTQSSVTIELVRDPMSADGTCQDQASATVPQGGPDGRRYANAKFRAPRGIVVDAFCAGSYTVTVASAASGVSAVLASTKLFIR
jgi:hypothetical protein